ncbi:MAG: DNA-binding protein [Syntrophobacteraceae bacterium]|nr:DNA-binding protein [Syntrophobacteraceae bacterium]
MKSNVRQNDSDVKIKDVAAVADRMVWAGRMPTVDSISKELNAGNIDRVRQCLTLWKAGYNHRHAEKTPITDFPPEVQPLVQAFEKRVTALEAKLKAQSPEALTQRNLLAQVNERQAAQIDALVLALADAEVKIADQDKRLSSLRKQIGFQQQALAKAKRRNGGAERAPAPSNDP